MRLLFLSNSYPPYSRGGYEMWCRDVAEALAGRGHCLRILTSRSSATNDFSDNGRFLIERRLALEIEPDRDLAHTALRLVKDRQRIEQENLSVVRRTINDFRPDATLIWGMWNVPRSVPALVEHLLPGHVAYYLCDYWPTLPNAYVQRWEESSRRAWTQFPKRLLGLLLAGKLEDQGSVSLDLAHPICVSRAVRDLITERGVEIKHAQVIYGGTHTEPFVTAERRKAHAPDILRLLYLGRLEPIKGVATAIEAMSILPRELSIRLEIYGRGSADYEGELRRMVREESLREVVTFQGLVAPEEIPGIMAQHDALLFTSEWEEPFARTVLEAMASGLVVVGTTTGGTGEILRNGQTGLTFTAGNASELATQITRLVQEPALARQLARKGQDVVLKKFTLQRMVDEIETELERLNARSRR